MPRIFRHAIALGYLLALLVLAVDALLVTTSLRTIARSNEQVERSRDFLDALDRSLSLLKDAETGQRGYLLTGMETYLEPYRDAEHALGAALGVVRSLASDSQKARADELVGVAEANRIELDQTIVLRRQGRGEEAVEAVRGGRGKVLMDRARELAAEIHQTEARDLELRAASARSAVRSTIASFATTTATALLMLIGVAGLHRRDIRERDRAASLIRSSEAWLSTTLTNIGDAVIATDAGGRVTFLNPIARSLTGWTQFDAVGRTMQEVFPIINETTREPVEDPVAKVLREGVIVGLANHTLLIARDGTETPIDDSAAPIRDHRGALSGVVLVFRDITERKRQEAVAEEQRRLALFGRDVGLALTESPDLALMTRRCVEATVRHLDGAFARIWTVDEAGEVLELRASAGLYTHLDGDHARVPVGMYKIGKIARDRTPHLTNSVVGDPLVPAQQWAEREGMVAFAGYPLIVEDRLVGVWAMFARHKLTETTLEAMESVASGIALGIDRRDAQERLDRQRDWLQVTLASIGDAVIATDHQGRVRLLNPIAERMTGWSQSEAVGQPIEQVFTIVDERTREPAENPVDRVIRHRAAVGLANHNLVVARDGTETPIEESATPIRNADGQVIGAVLVFQDATERRQHELALQRGEERYRALVEAFSQIVWRTEPDGRIVEDSPTWREFTGQTLEQWRGHGWLDAVHPDDRAGSALSWSRAVATRTLYHAEYRVRRADGTYRWMVAKGVPVLEPDGRIREWVGTNSDVTDRIEVQEELWRSDERLRLATEATGLGIWDFDPRTGVWITSEFAKKALGLSPANEMTSDQFLATIAAEDRPRVQRASQEALRGLQGGRYDVEYRAIGLDDGIVRWVASRGQAHFDGDGLAIRFVGTLLDITDRKQVEAEIRHAKEEAEHANKAKDQFLAILSHELRTPLNPILLAVTSMLERPTPAEEIRPNLEMIRQNVNLQSRLIDDLLDVMRIVRGKMPLHWEVVDAHVLIQHAVQICRSEVFGKGLKFQVDLSASRHHINADPVRLQQVFWNLIKNATKFTASGGSVAIISRDDPDSDRLLIEVIDTGIGIEPEILGRIFDPFQQGETSITRRYGGLGLGLAISKGIVEGHGGVLTAQSDGKGKGTTFRIALSALPEPRSDENGRPRADALRVEPPAPLALKVLLVEDEQATRRLMARLLVGLGHEVATAGTIAEALEQENRSGDFGLIVSDIGLPDGSGLELMRRIVARRGPIPAIALTGYGMEEDIQRSREAGFTAHMTKPIDFVKLEAMIRQVAS